MDPEDEFDDDDPSGLLLPPDDRLWRHPSEVLFSARRSHREVRTWMVAVFSGVIGAVLATGIVFAAGAPRTRDVDIPAVERDVDASPRVTLAAANALTGVSADRVRSSCVTLIGRSKSGTTTVAGVVFRSDGMVLTTADDVAQGEVLTAIVDGGRRVDARLVASDPASDLAVVKLSGSGYSPAPLGSALDLSIGDPIFALDPGTGDQPGSIGAMGQQMTSPSGAQITDLLAVRTASMPTLGGALIDAHGTVVAIGTALDPSGGIEYATPVDLAQEIATELLTQGHVTPVWLGVEGTDLTAAQAAALGAAGGALVASVYPASPATLAGIEAGDVVVGVDGRAVRSIAALIMAVRAEPAGTAIDLEVYRGARPMTLTAIVQPKPADDN